MDEDIYGTNIPHLKVKTLRRKIPYLEPVKITFFPKIILGKYKEVTICCDLMHINGIGFLNTLSRHIMFATGSMIKTKKLITLQMGSHWYINYICSVVSRSHICTLIVILYQYSMK